MSRDRVGMCIGLERGGGVTTLLLTPNGGHHMYGRQAGSTHPTGMLSCFCLIFGEHLGVLRYSYSLYC